MCVCVCVYRDNASATEHCVAELLAEFHSDETGQAQRSGIGYVMFSSVNLLKMLIYHSTMQHDEMWAFS